MPTSPVLRKAVIPAAGFGTRFLPASKAVPKEMAFILDKPAIQWLVEEAVAAGATDVVIVVSPRKEALVRHFRPDPDLARAVQASGKPGPLAALAELDRLGERVRFVTQTEQKGLGHALLCAEEAVGGEPFLVLLGDALVCSERPCAAAMAEVHQRVGGAPVIGLERVPPEKVSRYGIVAGREEGERLLRLHDVVEKPAPQDAPSDMAIAGRYVLTPEVMDALHRTPPAANGEIQLTDAFRALLRAGRPLYGYHYEGRRFDIGNAADCLAAVLQYARLDPRFARLVGA